MWGACWGITVGAYSGELLVWEVLAQSLVGAYSGGLQCIVGAYSGAPHRVLTVGGSRFGELWPPTCPECLRDFLTSAILFGGVRVFLRLLVTLLLCTHSAMLVGTEHSMASLPSP